MRPPKAFSFLFATFVASFAGPSSPSHAQALDGSTVAGAIYQSWPDNTGGKLVQHYSAPLAVRLCSVDRVLQTQSDSDGEFTFPNVPSGIYDLAVRVVPPSTIRGIEIKAGATKPLNLRMDIDQSQGMGKNDSDCFRDTPAPMNCDPTSFSIDYQQRDSPGSPLITGRVADWDHKRKGLAKTAISLTSVADPAVHYSAISDKHGAFQFAPPPGVYTLAVSLEGFHDLQIAGFLVPRENATRINVLTTNQHAVHLCE
jgi:hypothetical protein